MNTKKVFYAVLILGGIWAVCFLAAGLIKWIPFSICGFQYLTGLPCPFCGGTRCLAAMGKGHFLEAMLIHPLAFASVLALIFLGIYKLVTKKKNTFSPKFFWIVLGLVLVNWGYLLLRHFL